MKSTIALDSTITQKRTIDIPVPSFYKDKPLSDSYFKVRGILDEKTIVTVFHADGHTTISNYEIKTSTGDIVTAFLDWDEISEEEFMHHYNQALKSISLTPELVQGNKETVL